MRPHTDRLLIALVICTASPRFGQGQTKCLNPTPLAQGCRYFLFLDGVGAAGLIRGEHPELRVDPKEDLPSYAGGLVGIMRNMDSSSALGMSVEFDYSFTGRASVKGHYRRWLPKRASLDLSAGALWVDIFETEGRGDTRIRATGVSGDLAIVERRGLGLFTGIDAIRGDGRSSVGVHAGARAESGVALIAVAIVGGIYAVIWHPRQR